MNNGVSYNMFYEILSNLREYFHSYGRIDDSNAKLDEITKLISISFSLAYRGIRFDVGYVKGKALEYAKKEDRVAIGLRKVFEEEAGQPMFQNEDGTNIFGAEPRLNIQPTEDELAEKLVSEIAKIDFLSLVRSRQYSDFDLINECFGHFVRDNFRNNKEDAQYMTPLEIVEPILDVIFRDMEAEGVFDDKERNGAPIKIQAGKNEMTEISEAILANKGKTGILSLNPSVTVVSEDELIENCLNPTFYAANRLDILEKLDAIGGRGIAIKSLAEVADFVTKTRRGRLVDDETKHISVLHINPDTTISFREVMKFKPVCKGRECLEGDVIFSKINPRIPRMAVIPKSDYKLVCSNEFEIMRPKAGMDPYVLCHLLRTEMVMSQIINLTSGTSSSHSRIKTEQLGEIKLPIKDEEGFWEEAGRKLRAATESIYSSERAIESVQRAFEVAYGDA